MSAVTIKTFAESYRLKTALDSDGTTIIPGRSGQIYEHGDGRFGVIFQSSRFRTREGWNNRRKECEAAGMELWQDGDYQGALLFDPDYPGQVKIAIRVAGCKTKRVMTEAQRAVLDRARAMLPLRHTVSDPSARASGAF